ncbi:MAG TPA: alkaline phosphatase family protein [Gemmatimonadaceae bacterium]|nr:alkaline phosphatase family protein [Gemmatimonadaceae bacterium]
MTHATKVLVIGLDGMEPSIVEPMLDGGELPNLARLRATGGYSRCRTTFPAQTPVAWSTFATGVNPGGHGIFDFIRRDPATYLPDLALNRYEQKSAFLPPKAVNLRRGTPIWSLLSDAGIPSVVLRCPCTYPPDDFKGRMLSGMGVPDLRGGLGTATFYSSRDGVAPGESEHVVRITPSGGTAKTTLVGPRNPKTRGDTTVDLTLDIDGPARTVTVRSDGQPKALVVREGQWSEWLHVKFKFGMLQSVTGMVRFHLVRLEPHVELYASPVNFEPETPMFPISHPWAYANELERAVGTFYTTGMVEDHTGLSNERFSEGAYLDQCTQVLRERERMLMHELDRVNEGLLFCLFDTPDRLAHMFWRFREPNHPANRGKAVEEWAHAIEEHYRECDAIVGRVLEHADEHTLVIVLSDHGFSSFQRGVHINSWLHDNGFLALQSGVEAGEEAGDFFKHVDWSRTKAYALGLGSIYLNLHGREAQGIVPGGEAPAVARAIAAGLTGLRDAERGCHAVRAVVTREEVYSGAYAAESPDLIACFSAGYRVSWATALGGVPRGYLEDNVKRWGGDHIIDPALVPGVLFMNRPFDGGRASLLDLAPTILGALGAPTGSALEGASLLP